MRTTVSMLVVAAIAAGSATPAEATAQEENSSFGYVTQWGGAGNGDGQLLVPGGVATDPTGHYVYVADPFNNRVQMYTSDGAFVRKFGGTPMDHLPAPRPEGGETRGNDGIAVDPDGYVYVVDFLDNRIVKYTAAGKYVLSWGTVGLGDGQFASFHHGIAAGRRGIYVDDLEHNQIMRFSSSGELLGHWGGVGTAPGQFLAGPHGLAIGPRGDVYAVDSFAGRVERFTASGRFISAFGSRGPEYGQFIGPHGIAITPGGDVWISDAWGNRIMRFTRRGRFVGQWGSSGTGRGQFLYAEELAVDRRGNVYVSDRGNNRIQKFGS